ncbi:MAG TPA: bifunctional 5,10-methylenetetrahydrofolate dehydrogenase/5,10-methenyltetrahydrofolate cyclohydrolase [Spirochaetota bacterium]|nr:bifunctional 5,10-methylenetetrahydrofolate dehydrogenase/5,10-methenyltetrahydrofolate cyclohydrolase [Spirochaetota bacterium]HOS32908.1 bifunctional 5,10-methylenetetrahydrofolate dehydrogenase/5,10-methenyltetrahydrofolate cyclohydrolase [Spirochaetota bacterium]HOS56094.1 bifunctional 5,10-methylenetetrahydrofolate dehydrogenase/5,10-methenyltetrahydrofolate cyclohydrolase [Spirochaetota bacterium]HPK62295.1 bifunctional 5,10-methylenetetrahydrofolate dehydrogenase/5,10-methenyltetrahydr
MSDKIIKLTELSNQISSELTDIILENNIKAYITSIMVGDDPSSLSYLSGIDKRSKKLGVALNIENFDADVSEDTLVNLIDRLNKDNNCIGIIIQMPLPKQISTDKLLNAIDYRKDIDGLSYLNQGRLFSGNPFIIPATAWAVDIFLANFEKKYNFNLAGKTATIIGRSNTVGKPTFHLALKRNMTINVVHTKTVAAEKVSSQSDIVVAACGVPQLIDDKWIKKEALLIDVGIHCVDGQCKLCGDVNVEKALEKAAYITAVPGGIGSLTNSLLFANSIKSFFMINRNKEFKFNFET